jgi:hypothetical protein
VVSRVFSGFWPPRVVSEWTEKIGVASLQRNVGVEKSSVPFLSTKIFKEVVCSSGLVDETLRTSCLHAAVFIPLASASVQENSFPLAHKTKQSKEAKLDFISLTSRTNNNDELDIRDNVREKKVLNRYVAL